MEQNIQELWDHYKRYKMSIIRIPKEKWVAKKTSKINDGQKTQIQKAQRTPNMINTKKLTSGISYSNIDYKKGKILKETGYRQLRYEGKRLKSTQAM